MSRSVSPKEIYDHINRYVVGQEAAKRATANAIFMHYIKWLTDICDGKVYKNSNLLLTGPSGSGKTYMIRKGAEAIQEITGFDIMPICEIDCSQLTGSGWRGEDIGDLLEDHFNSISSKKKTKKDINKVSTSILFFDEIDKICMGASTSHIGEFNRQAQYTLLKLVEGTGYSLPKSRIVIPTHRMLCIFAGNFTAVRTAREKANKSMGFHTPNRMIKKNSSALHVELQKAGLSTQLAGRISIVAELEALTKPQLRYTLKHAEGSVYKEYQELLASIGYDLHLSDYIIRKVVDTCFETGTGVRGLQTALEEELQKEIFNMSLDWEDFFNDDEE